MKDPAILSFPGFKDFCRERSISLAILFGLQATGRAIQGSDLDLADWLEQPELLLNAPRTARFRRQLLRDLINYLETGDIDLVILNRASPLLKFQVARNGKPVHQKTARTFRRFLLPGFT